MIVAVLATAVPCSTAGVGSSGALTQAASEMTAVRILLSMKKAYGRCRSYRDSGEVRVRGEVEDGSFGSRLPFATAFVRGGPFRFEFTDRGLGERESRFILWASGSEVRAWWQAQGGERRAASLREALDAAAGVTGGASLRVPGMLLPAELGDGYFVNAPERLDDELVGGAACYRLHGRGRETPYALTAGAVPVTVVDERVTVWVDRTSLLLRKVEERRTLSNYRTVTTTTYEPVVDVEIPAEALAFDPPSPP